MDRGFSVDGLMAGVPGELYETVERMRKESPVSEGQCAVCKKVGTLLSGVCEECFIPWAIEAAKAEIRWRKRK